MLTGPEHVKEPPKGTVSKDGETDNDDGERETPFRYTFKVPLILLLIYIIEK